MISMPIAQSKESPKSILMRMAGGNGYSSIASMLDIDASALCASSPFLFGSLPELAVLIKKIAAGRAPTYEACFYSQVAGVTSERDVVFMGAQIPYKYLEFSKLKACPQCIAESRHLTQYSDLTVFTTCTRHNSRLVSECPRCKVPFNWKRMGLRSCPSCELSLPTMKPEFSYREEEHRLASLLDTSPNLVEKVFKVYKHLEGLFPVEAQEDGSLLDASIRLTLGEFHHFLAFADRAFVRYPDIPRRFKVACLLCSEDSDIQNIALRALAAEGPEPRVSHIEHGRWYRSGFRMEECAVALNSSRNFVYELLSKGLLDSYKCKEGYKLITLDSLSGLYKTLHESVVETTKKYERVTGVRSNHLSVLIESVVGGSCAVVTENWNDGVKGLAFATAVSEEAELNEILGVNEFADTAQTYPDAIRRIVKSGFVTPDLPKGNRGQILFSKKFVDDFNKKYVFLSALSKKHAKPTVLSAILEEAGVLPVAGPKVDASLIPLYKKKDVETLDLAKLVKDAKFKSKAGRKKKGEVTYDRTLWVESKDLRKHTGLNDGEISELVSRGVLVTGIPEGREADNRRYFNKDSVDQLLTTLSFAMPVADSWESLDISKSEFYLRFVHSGAFDLFRVGKRAFVLASAFVKMRAECKRYVSARTANLITGSPSKHFNNLLNTGGVSRVSANEAVGAAQIALIRRSEARVLAPTLRERSIKATLDASEPHSAFNVKEVKNA